LQNKSQSFQTQYNRALQNSTGYVGSYLRSLNGAEASLSGYVKYLITTKSSTIALTIATAAMKTALITGVTVGISLLVQQFSKWIHAQEESRKKSVEISKTYKEQTDSLDVQIKKYKSLNEALNAKNLSINETRSIKGQLLELQQSLIQSYGNEASNIDLVNGKYKDQLGLLEELSIDKADKYVAENRDSFSDAKKSLSKIRTYNLGTVASWSSRSPKTEDQQKLLDFIDTYNEFLELTPSGASHGSEYYNYMTLSVNADVKSADEIMHQFYKDLETFGKNNNIDASNLLENISGQLKEIWTDELIECKTIYDEFMRAEVVRNDTLRPLYQQSIQAVEVYNNALSSGEGISEAKKNLEAVRKSVKNAVGELEGSQEVFDYIYDGINKSSENAYKLSQEFKKNKSVKKLAEQLKGLTDFDLKAINFKDKVQSPGEKTFGALINILRLSDNETQSLIDKLVELGYVQGEVLGQKPDNENPILSLPGAIKTVHSSNEEGSQTTGLIEESRLLQEILADTGNIQQETYEKLVSCSEKYASALRIENGHITVNTSRLNQIAQSRQTDAKEAIRQALALKKQEWAQWNSGIDNYNGSLLENIQTTYGSIDALQSQITQFELLANAVDNSSNAFENFKNAQSTEDQDMYNTAQEAFAVLKGYTTDQNNENYGKFNRDEFQESARLLMDKNTYKKALNAKDIQEYKTIVADFIQSIEPLFDENNYNSAANLFNRINEILDSGDVPKADADWAERLGISEEMFHALSQLGNQYNFNNREIFESYQLNTLDEYQALLSNIRVTQEALNECTSQTSSEYVKLSQELDAAKQKYSEFKNETAETIQNSYADFIDSQANTNDTFTDYLKQSMGFEDSDITGIIYTLLDKAAGLRETLSYIHPDSAAYDLYKKQLEEILSLLDYLDFDTNSMNDTRSLEEKISRYTELLEKAEEYKVTLETADPESEEYKNAAQELMQLSLIMDNLRAPLTLEINSNLSEINAELSKFDEDLTRLRESLKHASGSNEAYAIHMEMKGIEKEKAAFEGQKKKLGQDLETITTAVEINADASEYNGKVHYTADFTEVVAALPPVLKGKIVYCPTPLPGLPSTAPYAPGKNKPTTASAYGTFHAYTQGSGQNVSVPRNEKALVNELGEEGIVRNGRLFPIRGGAQFVNLKRGDIVFNHKQMQELKKNGYTSGRGKLIGAYAKGSGPAYEAGTDATHFYLTNAAVGTTSPRVSNADNKSNDAAKEKAEEEKELFEEVIDWIERRLKNFQRKFDKWVKQAETAVSGKFITRYYKKAANAARKNLSSYDNAYNQYMAQANAVGLDEHYARKVRNGTIDIEMIRAEGSEDDVKKYRELADKVKKYQEWYDKAIESTTSFVETAEELYHLPLDKAAAKIEKFSDRITLLDKKLDNAIGSEAKNNLIQKQKRQKKKTLNANKEAKKASKRNLKRTKKSLKRSSVLNSPDVSDKDKKKIKKAVKNGSDINLSLFKEGSKAYNAAVKYNEALKAHKKATYESSVAQQEYNSWLVTSSKMKFDNIADDYQKQMQLLGHEMTAVDNRISEIEASGKKVNKSYYETQQNIIAQELERYKTEKVELEKSILGIKKGTDEWYDAFDQIQQINSSISEKTKEHYEKVNAINQLYFDLYDGISDSIDRLLTEQEFLQGLFAHEKLTDDETGSLTEAGIAKLGSLSAEYYAAKNNKERDAAVLKELLDVKANGSQNDGSYKFKNWEFNSLEDLQEKINDYSKKTQESVKEEYDLKTKIYDLMKERYQAEMNYLKDLIDAKKESLSAQKDLHDYNRTLQEKTNSISTLQKQIAAYSGDTSQEGLAKLQKLQKELADKQEDLNETEYSRYISDQQDMLDALYKEYEELTTKKLDDFMSLVQEGLKTADSHMSEILDFLKKTAADNGYIEETNGIFEALKGSIQENVNRMITALSSDAKNNSGTDSNGAGAAAASSASSAKPAASQPAGSEPQNLPAGIINTNPQTNAVHKSNVEFLQEETKKGYRKRASDYIKKHAKETKKDVKEFSDVNQVIYKNKAGAYGGKGKILPPAKLEGLAKNLDVTYNGGKKGQNLYQKLKSIQFPGFKKGGIVSVDDIEKQIRDNGDTSLVSVQDGEAFFTREQTELLKQFAEKIPDIILQNPANINDLIPVPAHFRSFETPAGATAGNNVVNIGNISLPNVKDYESFKRDMFHDMQTDKKFEGMMFDMEIRKLSNGGCLSKYRHRF
jgi:hypothetical protein